MEELGIIYIVVSFISIIVSIIFIVRWWGMTSDIKDIRNYLLTKDKPEIVVSNDEITVSEDEDEVATIENLKPKMKVNQCLVKVKRTNLIEIWDKKMWEEHVESGKKNFFEFLYKNY